jgi:hypothetical protein
MTHDLSQSNGGRIRPGAVAAGTVLLVLGVLFLLDTTGTVRVRAGQLIAPMILIAIGSSILLDGSRLAHADGRHQPRGTGGVWLIGIGVWMLISQTHLFGLSYRTSWPLLLIMAGLMTAIRGMR